VAPRGRHRSGPRSTAVRDLERSMEFFGALGFDFAPRFTDDKAACTILSDEA